MFLTKYEYHIKECFNQRSKIIESFSFEENNGVIVFFETQVFSGTSSQYAAFFYKECSNFCFGFQPVKSAHSKLEIVSNAPEKFKRERLFEKIKKNTIFSTDNRPDNQKRYILITKHVGGAVVSGHHLTRLKTIQGYCPGIKDRQNSKTSKFQTSIHKDAKGYYLKVDSYPFPGEIFRPWNFIPFKS